MTSSLGKDHAWERMEGKRAARTGQDVVLTDVQFLTCLYMDAERECLEEMGRFFTNLHPSPAVIKWYGLDA